MLECCNEELSIIRLQHYSTRKSIRMKNKINLFLFTMAMLFCLACQPTTEKQEATKEEEAIKEYTGPEAFALDGRELFPAPETVASKQRKDSLLAIAQKNFDQNSRKLENIIWLGRRVAYLSRYREAIDIYTKGLELHPNAPELYRHRGHRYISTRQFDKAIADFEKAAALAKDRPIEIEPDGIPNKLNQPLSTLQFNIWYHWALAYYLKGDFEKAAEIYKQCMVYSTNPDLLTATTDWYYMTLQRLGEKDKAVQLLTAITPELEIIENTSYFNRLLMYKGMRQATDLLDLSNDDPDRQLDIVTQGYGVGNWYWYNGQQEMAREVFEKILESTYWSAFGYIAAEADLARLNN